MDKNDKIKRLIFGIQFEAIVERTSITEMHQEVTISISATISFRLSQYTIITLFGKV